MKIFTVTKNINDQWNLLTVNVILSAYNKTTESHLLVKWLVCSDSTGFHSDYADFIRRANCFHDFKLNMCIYYVHFASERFEHFAFCESLKNVWNDCTWQPGPIKGYLISGRIYKYSPEKINVPFIKLYFKLFISASNLNLAVETTFFGYLTLVLMV